MNHKTKVAMLKRYGQYADLAMKVRPDMPFAKAVAIVQHELGCTESKAREVLSSLEFE